MRSTTEHTFSRVPQANIPRSTFNRSSGYKTTFDAGKLIPFFVDEVLPGDTFAVNSTLFARLATPFVPVMDNLFLDTFYFFVPNRLIWTHWQNFMGEEENPGDFNTVSYVVPRLAYYADGIDRDSIGDYFGIPPLRELRATGPTINALPFRAYALIWNEWFRDENLLPKMYCPKDDGPDDNYHTYPPQSRGKRHDYFTSALPWPQKGPGVEIPLGTSAPVIRTPGDYQPTFYTNGAPTPSPLMVQASGFNVLWGTAGNPTQQELNWEKTALMADLSQATAATINSLRQAFQIQKLYERDARGGTRYTEIIRSHFGVVSPDARLQRPEFLGGGTNRVNISPVAQTSGSPPDTAGYTTTPQANLAGIGTVAGSSGFTKSFTEHGFILGILEVRADLTYQQGLDRMWTRKTRFDYYWPALSHLGEQNLYNYELYWNAVDVEDMATFGYQERYAEYRYKPSRITSKLRTDETSPNGLDVWHLGQYFPTRPGLNGAFITDAPPVKRISAVPSEPDFILDAFIQCHCTRPMPVYSVPGMIDHF